MFVIAAVSIMAVLFSTNTVTAEEITEQKNPIVALTAELKIEEPLLAKEETKKETPTDETKKYTIKKGDYLAKIATKEGTTWLRLWNKNTKIEHPDEVFVGDQIVIPTKTEKLANRVLPEVVVPLERPDRVRARQKPVRSTRKAPTVKRQRYTAPVRKKVTTARRQYSRSNTYTPGQCTWHVKNKRGASLPNGLGSANTWYYRAKARGMATGTTPRVGAAAVRKVGVHVAYVTAVHGDGTITVSEMNYNWTPYATRTAKKNASAFYYIY